MNRQVLIEEREGSIAAAVLENGALVRFHELSKELLTGSIYLAKVVRVKKELGIFLDIGREKQAILKYREGLSAGDAVVVLISKEETEGKGASATERLALPGRYAVLNDSAEYRFSSRISEERKIALFAIPYRAEGVGFLFRSAAEKADDGAVEAEMKDLTAAFLEIKRTAKNRKPPLCLYREEAMEIARRLACHEGEIVYGLSEAAEELKRLKERKVEKNGIELVFDQTEAMMVVDVNYHRFQGSFRDADSANLQANLTAAEEIARQIRLRNIGGIIMIDFISLRQKEDKERLFRAFKQHLSNDHVKTSLEYMESLSLYAVVRRRRY